MRRTNLASSIGTLNFASSIWTFGPLNANWPRNLQLKGNLELILAAIIRIVDLRGIPAQWRSGVAQDAQQATRILIEVKLGCNLS